MVADGQRRRQRGAARSSQCSTIRAWRDDMPRMVVGSLGRQRNGAWSTTTANLWGSLALDKFSAKFESAKVAGTTNCNALGLEHRALARLGQGCRTAACSSLPWPDRPGTLSVTAGRQRQAVAHRAKLSPPSPLKAPISAGYGITRTVSAVEQKDKSRWSRGDVMRVRLEIDAQSDMTWVVVSDPVPGGATLLGSGLGPRQRHRHQHRESATSTAWAAFEERSFEAYRSYYGYLPRGKHVIEYTLRLSNAGRFSLPPTRVEALYAPETFGETAECGARGRAMKRLCFAGCWLWLLRLRPCPSPRCRRSMRSRPRTGRRTWCCWTGTACRYRPYASTRPCAGCPGLPLADMSPALLQALVLSEDRQLLRACGRRLGRARARAHGATRGTHARAARPR